MRCEECGASAGNHMSNCSQTPLASMPYFSVTITINAGTDNEGILGAAHDIVTLTDLLRTDWQFDVEYHAGTD